MFNIPKVAELIQHQIGEIRYQANVMYIAELLSVISPETLPEMQAEGAEEYVANRIVQKIEGVKGAVTRQDDVLTRQNRESLDNLTPKKMRTAKHGIQEITNFGMGKEDRRANMRDRLQKLQEIKEKLKIDSSAHLTALKSGYGNETANDWLSDVAGRRSRDQDSEFIQNQIAEVRKLSRANVSASKVQGKLRDIGITRDDLEELGPTALYEKYNVESVLGIKNDGSFRKRLQRLREEVL